jgi:hypothetical protein
MGEVVYNRTHSNKEWVVDIVDILVQKWFDVLLVCSRKTSAYNYQGGFLVQAFGCLRNLSNRIL